jgi:hypothetical protein
MTAVLPKSRAKAMRKSETVDVDGWRVSHCGHPTAIWPYFIAPPEGHPADRRIVMSFNGLGFQTKKAAVAVAQLLAWGELAVTFERCAPGVACVVGITANGEPIDDDRAPVGR